ncbi:MAG: (d)CMP kinase [Dehalococcoidia bacterium]
MDGPVASGKSAVGSLLARRLGFRFLDTGAMYRAFTWLLLERGIGPQDEEAIGGLAQGVSMTVSTTADEQSQVHVDGVEVTAFLVRPEVEANVSDVSRLSVVREAMVRIQREEAQLGEIVVAGRDIGTVVLPDADLKVYLDAPRLERARRRWEQARFRGETTLSIASVMQELERRDAIDSGRELSPLRPAADALILQTDGLSLEQVVERILALAR